MTLSDGVGIEHAYFDLGGFRVGKTDSLFSTFTGYAGNVMYDDLIAYGPFGTHQISYTWNGGNGFSAAVALEEGDGDSDRSVSATSASFDGNLYTLDSYVPNVVAGSATPLAGVACPVSSAMTPSGKSGLSRVALTSTQPTPCRSS